MRNGGITKSEAVKQAFTKLGSDAKPSIVIEHVKKTVALVKLRSRVRFLINLTPLKFFRDVSVDFYAS
jgi:hypothetical protein